MMKTLQTGLNNYIEEAENEGVEKSPLEMIAEMKIKKEGKDWGYKDNPRYIGKKR